MLKLAADNNLEIKLVTTWENQRIGPVKTEWEEKSLEGFSEKLAVPQKQSQWTAVVESEVSN